MCISIKQHDTIDIGVDVIANIFFVLINNDSMNNIILDTLEIVYNITHILLKKSKSHLFSS